MFSASLVQLGTTRNYIAVEEKFLGFALVYELPCTELHESGSFLKRVDPFCAINRHEKFSEGTHSSKKKMNLQKLIVWVNILCSMLC